MKFFTLFVIFTLSSVVAFSQNQKISITHLSGNFYIHTSYKLLNEYPYPSNGLLAIADSGAILIDTPWDEDQTKQLVVQVKENYKKDIILCIVTHSHEDRTAGLNVLKKMGVKTYSSILIRNISIEKNEKIAEYYFINDTTFNMGNVSFQTFYPGEGHTKDNLVIWFPDTKLLFGGCIVKSSEAKDLGNTSEANIEQWPVSIKNIQHQFPEIKFVIPGHQKWGDENLLGHTLELLK